SQARGEDQGGRTQGRRTQGRRQGGPEEGGPKEGGPQGTDPRTGARRRQPLTRPCRVEANRPDPARRRPLTNRIPHTTRHTLARPAGTRPRPRPASVASPVARPAPRLP